MDLDVLLYTLEPFRILVSKKRDGHPIIYSVPKRPRLSAYSPPDTSNAPSNTFKSFTMKASELSEIYSFLKDVL